MFIAPGWKQVIIRLRSVNKRIASRIHEYLEPSFVEGVLREHESGRANRRLLIWSLLAFESWLRRFRPSGAA